MDDYRKFAVLRKVTIDAPNQLPRTLDCTGPGCEKLLDYNFRYLSLVDYDSRWRVERCGAQEQKHLDFFWGLEGEMQIESAQGIQKLTPGTFLIVPYWHDRILSIPHHSRHIYTRTNTLANFPFLDQIELRESQFSQEIYYYLQRLFLDEDQTLMTARGSLTGNAEYRFHLCALLAELVLRETFTKRQMHHNPLSFFLKKAAEGTLYYSVEEFARRSYLSASAFYKLCKALTGHSPQRHLQEQRLRRAQMMLGYGDDSIAEIARRLGYSSLFAFSKAFRKMTGRTPTAYRREIQG